MAMYALPCWFLVVAMHLAIAPAARATGSGAGQNSVQGPKAKTPAEPSASDWAELLERVRQLEAEVARLRAQGRITESGDAGKPLRPVDEGTKPEGAGADAPDTSDQDAAELTELEAALAEDVAIRTRNAPSPSPSPQVVPARTSPQASLGSGSSSLGALANPQLSLILDAAAAWFSVDEPMQVGAHDPRRTGFNLQQLEMHLAANVDPFFRFDTNLVFSQFGVEIEEAVATTLALPGRLQIRAGQFLTRFGRLNPTHPHSWSFVDQPLVNGKFLGPEGSRGLGAEVSVLLPLPWYLEVIASATDAAGACCARSFLGGDDWAVRGVGDFLYTAALRQFFALNRNWGLQWGLAGQFGPNASGPGNRSEIYGSDIYLRYRPVRSKRRTALSLQIEGMHRRRQVPQGVLADWGGYGQAVWNIDRRWEIASRYELVSGLDDDPLDPSWNGLRQRASIQGTFYPSHFSRIRIQGNVDHARWQARPNFAAILALEVLIGAHGAHHY